MGRDRTPTRKSKRVRRSSEAEPSPNSRPRTKRRRAGDGSDPRTSGDPVDAQASELEGSTLEESAGSGTAHPGEMDAMEGVELLDNTEPAQEPASSSPAAGSTDPVQQPRRGFMRAQLTDPSDNASSSGPSATPTDEVIADALKYRARYGRYPNFDTSPAESSSIDSPPYSLSPISSPGSVPPNTPATAGSHHPSNPRALDQWVNGPGPTFRRTRSRNRHTTSTRERRVGPEEGSGRVVTTTERDERITETVEISGVSDETLRWLIL